MANDDRRHSFDEIPPPGPNTDQMVRAWEMNIETQRQVVDHLAANDVKSDQVLRDNHRTRRTVWLGTVALALACGWVVWRTYEVEASNTVVVRTVQTASSRLTQIEKQQRTVMGVVTQVFEAQQAEADFIDALVLQQDQQQEEDHPAEPVTAAAPTVRRKMVVAKRRRQQAQQAALQAQIALAPTKRQARAAKARLREVRAAVDTVADALLGEPDHDEPDDDGDDEEPAAVELEEPANVVRPPLLEAGEDAQHGDAGKRQRQQ